MDLGSYLAEARTKPWAWRRHDCTAFPAIWAGMADALPYYSTEAEAEAIIADAGGLVPLWESAAPSCADPVPVDEIQPGDVGIIELPCPRTKGSEVIIDIVECGAIWAGRRWVFVPQAGGVAGVSAPAVLKAWRPRCHRP